MALGPTENVTQTTPPEVDERAGVSRSVKHALRLLVGFWLALYFAALVVFGGNGGSTLLLPFFGVYFLPIGLVWLIEPWLGDAWVLARQIDVVTDERIVATYWGVQLTLALVYAASRKRLWLWITVALTLTSFGGCMAMLSSGMH
jgi:hypothetical protein